MRKAANGAKLAVLGLVCWVFGSAPGFVGAAPGPAHVQTLSDHGAMADLRCEGAWLRLLPGDLPAAGYFTVHNPGKRAVVLVGVQTPAFAKAMLHRSVERNGQARMLHVDRVAVPAGGKLAFAPGGYHIMFMKPRRRLTPGDNVPVTLLFSDGTRAQVSFQVRGPTGAAR